MTALMATTAGGRCGGGGLAVGARVLTYGYDSRSRLERFADGADSSCDATYRYDGAGRWIGMTVGGKVYRFVYDPAGNGLGAGLREKQGVLVSGDDVVAEYEVPGSNRKCKTPKFPFTV